MTNPELTLALTLALAEVERLRAAPAVVVEQGPKEALLAEAAQCHVSLLLAASHLATRAPRVAEEMRYRADRLLQAMREAP